MFGRKAILPVDLAADKSNPDTILQKFNKEQELLPSHVMRAAEQLQEILLSAKTNIAAAQQRQKEQYDRKTFKPGTFDVAEEMLLCDFTCQKRKEEKWTTNGLVFISSLNIWEEGCTR
jgi:hypothetical protein